MRTSFFILGFISVFATACSQSPAADGGADAAADVTMVDHTAPPDTAADIAPAPDSPGDAVAISYGSCGHTVYNCLCACPDNDAGAMCQVACLGSGACHTCYLDAFMSCCPSEYAADTDCITAAVSPAADGGPAPCGSTDYACIESMCMTVDDALNTCSMSAGCNAAVAVCLGTFPETCMM